nr:alanine racemase [Helcococcus sueciensis]
MFLDKLQERNNNLIDAAIKMHQKGLIIPDSYVIDVDTLIENARFMLKEANKKNIKLLFMLKQLGRNPYIAKKLVELGYEGAVVVDFNEARIMMDNNIPIGNVGNLVQTPNAMIDKLVEYGVGVMTVFSMEKLEKINQSAEKLNKVQNIIIKVYKDDDVFYSGQESGINLEEFESFIKKAKQLKNINIVGITSFPTFLYNKKSNRIEKQNNYYTVYKAKKILENNGIEVKHVNLPSVTCISNINENFDGENIYGEPGHGLTGTTPAHAYNNLEEIPCVLYLSEVSHNFNDNAFVYGGGHYRRSHVKNAIVSDGNKILKDKVLDMDPESIDYYFKLKNNHNIGDSVVMSFRFQIFVTRSRVVLLEKNKEEFEIVGVYDSLGRKYDE